MSVHPTGELAAPTLSWPTRFLLSIPEPWLDRWSLKINAACAGFVVAWALGSLALTLNGAFRHAGLTPGLGIVVQVGWVPVMMLNLLLIVARSAHMHVWFDATHARQRQIDDGMAQVIGQAVHEGVTRAMAGDVAPEGQKGPTLQ